MATKRVKVSALDKITQKSELTADDFLLINDGDNRTRTIDVRTFANRIGSGYEHTGAFQGKPLSNNYVWEPGQGIRITQAQVDAGAWQLFSLDQAVHDAVDNPYWDNPTPSGTEDVGLFQGANLPVGLTGLFDFDFDFDTRYPTLESFTQQNPVSNAAKSFSYFQGTQGCIDLSETLPGDQLRVRFDFNTIPQVANTIIEPALWYSNRDEDTLKETFSFSLTSQPINFGQGSPGQTFLNRVEISAWITSYEDVSALTLPAIKSNNPVIIQPLGLLATIIR